MPPELVSVHHSNEAPRDTDSTAATLSRSERYLDPTKGHAALDDQSRTAISVFIQALNQTRSQTRNELRTCRAASD